MKHKKAQIFSLMFGILTLVLIGMAIYIYLQVQEDITASAISPVKVLETKDRLEIFEMLEEDAIKFSYKEVTLKGIEFGSSEFITEFRKEFFDELNENPKYIKNFLIENLTTDGEKVLARTFDYNSFLENVLYPRSSMYYEGNYLVISREEIGKKMILKAEGRLEVRYDYRFRFEFEKVYILTSSGEVYEKNKFNEFGGIL